MAVSKMKRTGYGIPQGLLAQAPLPIISQRAPTASDRVEIGTPWIDVPNQDVYMLVAIVSNAAVWINCGGGGGLFNTLTVAGASTFTAGPVTMSAFGHGIIRSNATGVLSSVNGTNGQVIIAATGAAPTWAALTAGAGINITNGANSITIAAPGATAVSYPTDAGGPVVPDGAGAVNVLGGLNISTDGTVANTITINLENTIAVPGKITAGVDFEVQSGTTTITSDTNAANAIYLHANGGVNEQIRLRADQGTSVDSIFLQSDLGGISLNAGLNAAAITLNASNAAGGVEILSGTTGIVLTATNGPLTLTSGTGAVDVGADATVHATTLGSATGASATTIQAGTANLVVTSTGTITLDAAGVLELNSSAGIISIGNDAVAQNINVGTGAAARTITLGNATGATSIILNAGTGAVNIGSNAVAHTTTVGTTTGAGATTLQAGTGNLIVNGGGDLTIDSAGVLELNSSAGIISIGNDAVAQNMNIGTGAAARVITIGNATGASSVVVNTGTGNLDLGVTATAHTTRLGSTMGASATTIQTGTGALTVTAGGILDVNATGAVTIDSTGGTIGIGEDADAQNINIGTGAAARIITIGNATGATEIDIVAGTGDASFAANGTAHATLVGSNTGASSTDINAGTGGLTLAAAGIVDIVPATDTQAAAAVTINANVGVGTFTGLTTAAAASQVLTVNNTVCTATSAILCTLANKGANDAQCTVTRVLPAANSFTVTYRNDGSAALNGDLILTFFIIAA